MNIISIFKKNKASRTSDPFSIKEGRYKESKIDGYSYNLEWTEDSYDPETGKKDIIGSNFEFKRLRLFGLYFLLAILALAARSSYLQIVKGAYYYSIAEGNRIRIERIEPMRGIIYDKNHIPLVRNKANFLLYFVPVDIPNSESEREALLQQVSGILGDVSVEELKINLSRVEAGTLESYRPLFVKDNIDYEKAMKLYLKSDNLPGVIVTNKIKREYNQYGRTLSHVLGYTGKISPDELKEVGDDYTQIDYIGKMGVEYFWESELKGSPGKKRIEVDALGKEKRIFSKTEAIDGNNLVLSLDVLMQKKLEDIISAHLEKLNLKKAAAVVLDPNNGEVLSLVSYPSFDNNIFARGISTEEYKSLIEDESNPLFNRAISGEYPSGSTIKPVISAAALEEGIITENTSFNSVGGIRVGQWFFPDWKAGGHGITNVRKAIAQSVNTFYYYIGGGYNDFKGLGVDKIVEYSKMFGLGSQTGIDLAGEAGGFLPTRQWKEESKGERWYVGDTYHLAIGQGDLLVTPLQVANFTSVFANGGKLYRPHLIKQRLNSNDKVIENVMSIPVRENFISDYHIKIVRQGMRRTVTQGSARSLSSLPVETAGKTGTAQWSSKENPHAWFIGFAPYENPKLAFAILVEAGGEGSSVSVPIAREFLQWYFGEYKK